MTHVETISESLLWGGVLLTASLVATIGYSIRKGGIKEMIENLFLWFLISFGFWNLIVQPSDVDDEISAGILFIAFGVCRIAKHFNNKT